LTDAATHQVLVDSNGWEGRRDVLAQRVADLLGQPASRVRATLAVPGTPVTKCASVREAEGVVATLRDAGLFATIRVAAASALVGGVRVPLVVDVTEPIASDATIQAGWRQDLGGDPLPPEADGATVVGMPSLNQSPQRTTTLGDAASESLKVAARVAPQSVAEPPTPAGEPELGGKTPTGAHLAIAGNAAKQVSAKRLLSSAPEPGAWSDVLGGALGAKLLGDHQQPLDRQTPAAAPGALRGKPITPHSATTMAPASARSASTATQLAAGSTRVHGPSWDVARGEQFTSQVFDEAAAQIQSAWPSQYADEKPLEAAPSKRAVSQPRSAVQPPESPGLGMQVETPSGAWNTSPELGDGFALLRRDEELAHREIEWPTLTLATLFAVLAPGAGQAYLASAREGLVYAFGAPLLKPWYDGLADVRAEVGRVESGAALPRRSASVLRGAAFVGVFWSVVLTLVVGMMAGFAATQNPTPVVLDEAALQAAADERHAAGLALVAAAEEEIRLEHAAAESAASAERVIAIRDLLRNAQLACETENYRLCRDFTLQLLALDGENVRGLRLHATALAEGLNEPAPLPVDESDAAAMVDE
jgi:hypothetical protein